MLLQNREDMLEEVELLVAGRSPEVVAMIVRLSFSARLSSLTIVTLLFLPKGGLVITIA